MIKQKRKGKKKITPVVDWLQSVGRFVLQDYGCMFYNQKP